MTPNEILDKLIAAKVPSDLILAVAKLIAEAETAGRIRALNAERQRRHREQHVTLRNVTSRSVTGRNVTSHDPSKVPPTPPLNTPTIKPKKVLSMSIPLDFIPDLAYAAAKGWAKERVESEAQRFKDHALAKGQKYKDWQAAWRNWVNSPYQQQERSNGKSRNGSPSGDPESGHRSWASFALANAREASEKNR